MLRAALFVVLLGPLSASAQTNLAPGFSGLPAGATIVLMPADIELFEISTGGVSEPRADWSETAARHVTAGLRDRTPRSYYYGKHLAQVQAIAASARIMNRESGASASP